MNRTQYAVLAACAAIATSCAECAPGRVGDGVSRLTMRNFGAIVDALNRDDRCGFANTSLTAVTDGAAGKPGQATWSIDQCTLDFTTAPLEVTDCNGTKTTISGKAIVSAKKIVRGVLTGDPAQPVAPNSSDAALIEVTRAVFDHWQVIDSSSDAMLTMISGSIAGKLSPQLALDDQDGVCKIPTRNVALTDVIYDQARVHVKSPGHSFDVEVPFSKLNAVNGKIGDQENAIWGEIVVWNSREEIPTDDDGLNPDYDTDKFQQGWSCTEHLAQPPSFECGDVVSQRLAQGAARLSIRDFGAIVQLVNDDTRCGFESMAVKTNPMLSGAAGSDGSATWSVDQCAIDLTTPLETTDCSGTTTRYSGRVLVSAKRTVTGALTGDPDQPAVPGGPDAVTVSITSAELTDFNVTASNSDASLAIASGTISGTAHPRLAVSAELGVCKVPTKNVEFADVAWTRAEARLTRGDDVYEVTIDSSKLAAVNGKHDTRENALSGSITLSGTEHALPSPGETSALDPDYDAPAFDAAYACTMDLAQPLSFDCSHALEPRIAQGAARLTVRNFGTIADRLDEDTACGFKSRAVLSAAQISGDVGGLGSATSRVERCTLDFPEGTVAKTSCSGVERKISGRVTISATKTLSGRLTGNLDTPVVPMTDTPAQLVVDEVIFENLRVGEGDTGLTWVSGGISGKIFPRVAADSAQHGACGFKTPIARFEDLHYGGATHVLVQSPSGTFQADIDGSNFRAVNGALGGEENVLAGAISVNGTEYSLPTDPMDDGLDPNYDPAMFDAEWICGTVEMPVRFDCEFIAPLAQGAAQLGVKAIGTLAQLLEEDTRCGFSSTAVKSAVTTQGTLGDDGGSGTYRVAQPCELAFAMPFTQDTDCNGKKTWVSGRALVSGTKTLHGFVTGDPEEPIAPTSRDAVDLDITATLTDFAVWTEPGDNKLTIKSGQFSGTIHPRLAVDDRTGACSIPTPVAELSDVAYHDASLRIDSEQKIFDVVASTSRVAAVNGRKDSITNQVSGSITLDGRAITLAPGALDPMFDQVAFDNSFACTANLRLPLPANDQACNLREVIGNGAARLFMLALGNITGMANEDSSCGFSTQSVLTNPTSVVGDVGDYGSMSWYINGCGLSRSGNSPLKTDCLGRETYLGGSFDFWGGRTVTGLRDEVRIIIIIRFDSIIPTDPDSVEVGFDGIDFSDFWVSEVEPGQTEPFRSLLVRSGSMSGTVRPVLGERASDRGRYDVPTPVAHLIGIDVSNADIRVRSEKKRFNVMVSSAHIEAFNGSWSGAPGMTNSISGTIVVDGQTINISPHSLNPQYSQVDFDTRYECTDDLVSLVPPSP